MLLEKRLFACIFLLSLSSVLVALVSQHVFGMAPCAWCVFQRLIYLVIALLSLIAWLHAPSHPTVYRLYALSVTATSVAGLASAIYQMRVAATMFSCAQTLADRWMTQSGLESAVPWLFGIYASCMDAVVYVLGVEYGAWSAMMYGLIALLGCWAIARPPRGRG